MTAPVLPKSVLRATLKSYLDHGRSQNATAAALGLSRGAVQDRLRKAAKAGLTVPAKAPPEVKDHRPLEKENARLRSQIERMTAAANTRFKPMKVTKRAGKDDTIRVIQMDSHGSYADPVAMGLYLHDLAVLQPDEIVMIGDHVDAGGFLAQHHTLSYIAQGAYTFEQDIQATRSQLDQARVAAPNARTFYLAGNHEDRVERWCLQQAVANGKDADFLRRTFAPQFLLGLAERGIEYKERSKCYDGLPVPGAIKLGACVFVHDPGFYDQRRTLARFGCSVVHGHTHAMASVTSSTVGAGEIGVWSFGCLSIKQQMYQHSRPSGHVHGYGIQLVSRSGHFLTISVPLIGGVSYLNRLLGKRI